MNGLSLFANVGIAETHLEEVGVNITVANEIIEERGRFYRHLYPDCNMIIGDITDPDIYSQVIRASRETNVEFLLATPPCQGMSLAGKKDENDRRNYLIEYVVSAIKDLNPKYVFMENVTMQLKTSIMHNGTKLLIPDYLKKELENDYIFNENNILDTKFYGVAQQRKRAVFLLVRKDLNHHWELPQPEEIITLDQILGDLPSVDPLIREEEYRNVFPEYEEKRRRALSVSKWHIPPKHVWRNVEVMLHTPTGCSARGNEVYFPKKKDGTMVGGAPRTYMRMDWSKPAPTITSYNHTISSFQNVHPGRFDKKTGLYTEPRVLTIFEMMKVMSLPDTWDIPEWASESLIRKVIGEGVPPVAVMKITKELKLGGEKS